MKQKLPPHWKHISSGNNLSEILSMVFLPKEESSTDGR